MTERRLTLAASNGQRLKKQVQKKWGVCRKCGRKLLNAMSKKRGYGPVCAKLPAVVYRALEEAGQLRLPGIS